MAQPILHHVTYKTTRLQEMIDWYGLVTGLKPLFAFEGGAWMSNDAANHRLALLTSPALGDDPDKLTHTGLHHSAFEFGTLDELLGAYTRLRELGIVPHATLHHGCTVSMYYVDPDGNSVELQVDAFGDWARSAEFLGTPQFAANPIGVTFDPDALVAARASGASPEELLERVYQTDDFASDGPLDLRFPMP